MDLILLLNYGSLEDKDLSKIGTDITSWIRYDFNEIVDVKIKMKVIEVFSLLPLEKRGFKEITEKYINKDIDK